MKRIPLSAKFGPGRGYALVDDEDFDRVAAWNWALADRGHRQYANRTAAGRHIYLHRVICGLESGDGKIVDHVNGDGLDNRRTNLRVVSNAENMRNRSPRQLGTSRYRGVYLDKRRQRWYARAKVDYRNVWLGSFEDEDEAGQAVEDFWREFDARALDACASNVDAGEIEFRFYTHDEKQRAA